MSSRMALDDDSASPSPARSPPAQSRAPPEDAPTPPPAAHASSHAADRWLAHKTTCEPFSQPVRYDCSGSGDSALTELPTPPVRSRAGSAEYMAKVAAALGVRGFGSYRPPGPDSASYSTNLRPPTPPPTE